MVVNDALMRPVKEVQKATHFKCVGQGVWMTCSSQDA